MTVYIQSSVKIKIKLELKILDDVEVIKPSNSSALLPNLEFLFLTRHRALLENRAVTRVKKKWPEKRWPGSLGRVNGFFYPRRPEPVAPLVLKKKLFPSTTVHRILNFFPKFEISVSKNIRRTQWRMQRKWLTPQKPRTTEKLQSKEWTRPYLSVGDAWACR
jgi:hypothetical protein